MGSAGNSLGEPGEARTPEGAWRRLSAPPEPTALVRMRALLREVTPGVSALAADGAITIHHARFVATLCDSTWTDGARRASRAARTLLRRRLRALGLPPVGVAAAAGLPDGSPVHLQGRARGLPPGRQGSHIWQNGETEVGGVWWLISEGHDFLLEDDTGQSLCVIGARGHLINADRLADGDRVSVVGHVDHIADPRALTRSPHARGAPSLAVRAGDQMPLVLRKI